MTDNEKSYLNRGKREQDDLVPPEFDGQGSIPTPFGGDDGGTGQDQTMTELDEALQAATDGGEFIAVDDPYGGESDSPGQPT